VAPVARDVLVGSWTHSHEEDSGDLVVYRPTSYAFPRSRGRDSFELAADGSLVERAIGPADRSVPSPGRWELSEDGRLVLRPGAGGPERAFEVVSAAPDLLVLRRCQGR
jgi:hypothetical protein